RGRVRRFRIGFANRLCDQLVIFLATQENPLIVAFQDDIQVLERNEDLPDGRILGECGNCQQNRGEQSVVTKWKTNHCRHPLPSLLRKVLAVAGSSHRRSEFHWVRWRTEYLLVPATGKQTADSPPLPPSRKPSPPPAPF